jgi:GDP-4-dehydro-6-deoxy-D-mannose reductase
MKKIFLTGGDGFVGSYFTKSDPDNSIDLKITDISNREHIAKQLEVVGEDDYIVHLAAQSHVGYALDHPIETFDINVIGTFNLLRELAQKQFKGRLLIISSGDIYGAQLESEMPLTEHSELRPQNPYSASKVMAEYMAYAEGKQLGIEVIFARSFNHIGTGQKRNFVISAFAKQLVEMEQNGAEQNIKVGNLAPKRDFTHVSDIISAYKIILDKGEAFTRYNVASGKSHSIENALNKMISMTSVDPKIIIDENLVRKNDQLLVSVDNSKLKSLGWKPNISFDQALEEVLNYWRNNL